MEQPPRETDLIEALEGYVRIPPSLWGFIPMQSRLRVFRRSGGESREEQFRAGGQLVARQERDGQTVLTISWGKGAMAVPVDDIEELWKRYDNGSFIELHMIAVSLMQKDRRIIELEMSLEKIVDEVARISAENSELQRVSAELRESVAEHSSVISRLIEQDRRLATMISELR